MMIWAAGGFPGRGWLATDVKQLPGLFGRMYKGKGYGNSANHRLRKACAAAQRGTIAKRDMLFLLDQYAELAENGNDLFLLVESVDPLPQDAISTDLRMLLKDALERYDQLTTYAALDSTDASCSRHTLIFHGGAKGAKPVYLAPVALCSDEWWGMALTGSDCRFRRSDPRG